MKTLKQLTAKFDWVNDDITEDKFPLVEVPEDTEYKLFHFDRYVSSEDAIKEIEREGRRPANISELLAYDWDGKDFVAALGSVAEVGDNRHVPYLYRDGSERDLNLRWFDVGWNPVYRFLAVRNPQALSTQKSDLGTLESLSLSRALEIVKEAGYEVSEQSLAKKFQAFRSSYGSGNGDDYWNGLEEIAKKHYSN